MMDEATIKWLAKIPPKKLNADEFVVLFFICKERDEVSPDLVLYVSDRAGIGKKKVRKIFCNLEKKGFLSVKESKYGKVVSINYEGGTP